MSNLEVNQIIAEYMGWEFINWDEVDHADHISGTSMLDPAVGTMYRGTHFTRSIDALVPVWEKLGTTDIVFDTTFTVPSCRILITDVAGTFSNARKKGEESTKSIQESAAYATAKAIKKLDK